MSSSNGLQYTPWFERSGDVQEVPQHDVDVMTKTAPMPFYWHADYTNTSASAENTGNEFNPPAGLDVSDDMMNIDPAELVRQHATQSIHGERTYVPYGYKTQWNRDNDYDDGEYPGVSVAEKHYQNVNAEAEHGLKSVDGNVRDANVETVKRLGDTLRGRDRGLERFNNAGYQQGPPRGIGYDTEPNMPTTDLERINMEVVPTISAFVSSGTEV